MKAVIADDEPHLARHLAQRLAALWPELTVVAVAANGIEAKAAIEEHAPQLAFLDIRMPGLSGLDVVAALAPAVRSGCRFVFVTAYDEFAVQAFEREAVDYLLKPVSDERLAQTVDRLRREGAAPRTDELLARLQALLAPASSRLSWVRAAVGSEVRLVAVAEVCYFQAADKYTAVFTREAELLIRTPIKDLIQQLDPEQFWQVHRGTVINLRQIVSARHDDQGRVSLKLRDRPETVQVSRAYAHLFKQM